LASMSGFDAADFDSEELETLAVTDRNFPKLVMLGSGGHARVLQQTLRDVGFELHGYVAPRDVDSRLAPDDGGVEVAWLGYDANLLEFDREDFLLINGIGSAGSLHVRQSVFEKFTEAGFNFLQIVSDTAIVSDSANLLEGVQVLAGAIIGVDAFIDEDTIVNTGAIVEHDAVIGRSCHISVAAKLAGEVSVGQGSHIGIGATIIQGLQIGENCIIGAGAVVIRDVPDNHMAVGVPAQNRPIES
jgi:sugar O-acyltransferase (sialic acid O-acetyltransferase NeuD family)